MDLPIFKDGLTTPIEDFLAQRWHATLMQAKREGLLELLDVLLTYKAILSDAIEERGLEEMLLAVPEDNLKVVNRLLGVHVNANAITQNHSLTDKCSSALAVAASEGHVEIVEALLAAGADVNLATGTPQRTVLYTAAESGNEHVIVALLAANADVNGVCEQTPVIAAANSHHGTAMFLLLLAGADINKPAYLDENGLTPWQATEKEGNEIVKSVFRRAKSQAYEHLFPAHDKGGSADEYFECHWSSGDLFKDGEFFGSLKTHAKGIGVRVPGWWLGWEIVVEDLLREEAAREEAVRKDIEEAVRRMAPEGLIAYMQAVKRARTYPWEHRKQDAKVKDALLASALLEASAEASSAERTSWFIWAHSSHSLYFDTQGRRNRLEWVWAQLAAGTYANPYLAQVGGYVTLIQVAKGGL
ncbi:hypothetical protein OEA41_010578 [Lepraria neglecta]|uniref:Ankyrin n=1 Tax=Lepraria neglecta TaxID=209136 RepID=A0AAD9YY40_9LECA|nr:hypothetical protein OEA41_010578 [Lepraria neglecta]